MLKLRSEEWNRITVVGTRGPEWDIPEFAGRGYELLDTTLNSLACEVDNEGATVVLTLQADNGDTCQLAFDGVWDLTLKTENDPRSVGRI